MTALVFLAAFSFYLAGASPSIAARDCADMAASAYTLGVAHPPGYPLYSILGHLWLSIFPMGNPAYRLAVLSCLAAAGAGAFVFQSVRRRSGSWAGLASSAIVIFSAPLWKFALLQEKYAFHACFVAALFYLSEGEAESFWRRARLSGFIAGLGLVNHQSLLLVIPGLIFLWHGQCRRLSTALSSAIAAALPWVGAGLSLYFFLWVRLGSAGSALAVLLRAQYGTGTLSAQLSRPLTPESAVLLFGWSLKATILAVSVPAAAAAVYGAFVSWREDRGRAVGLVLAALMSGPLFVIMASFDVSNWVAASVLEPACLVSTLVAAIFAGAAVARLDHAAPAALALSAAALLLRSPVPERRDDFLAHDYIRNLRRAVPPGAALLASGDTALFGLRWLELTSPRIPTLELEGSDLVDTRTWLASQIGRTDVFVTGLPFGKIPARELLPEGLVQRVVKAGPGGRDPLPDEIWKRYTLADGSAAPLILRRSSSWRRDESYARDAKRSYAFAAWSSARLREAWGMRVPETLDLTAVALDPADYQLE